MSFVVFVLGVVGLILLAVLSEGKAQAQGICISLLLSPAGALIRYRMGLRNKRWRPFPIFTLAANLAGCMVTGSMGAVLASGVTSKDHPLAVGVATGFAGSLSTVSTFMAEVATLKSPYEQHRYLGTTHLLAQGLLLAINLPVALIFDPAR